MAENYTVNYNINVNSQAAINALNSFQTATNKLTAAGNKLRTFEKRINSTIAQFNKLSKRTPLLDFSTAKANQKLDVIIRKLEKINRLAKQNRTITINTRTTNTGGAQGGGTAPMTTRRHSSSARVATPRATGNYSYKVLGPAMIDTGGIGAIDMLKGMGIAYGVTGLGTMMSQAIKDATEYNNLMQTTRNILETHDPSKGTFDARFKAMERLARHVGITTKYTAPEVADATKFLAMAGLDLEAINHSISPIANIALVGDTELGKTADLVTNIMTGYGIDPRNIDKAADVMTMTFTSANTTLTEIAEAYKYSASLLAAADVSFEEATAALGILGNAGIKGSQGGTSLRTILANIVNPRSKKRADAWESIGVARFNADGSVRSLSDIFQDLHDKDLGPDMYYKLFDRTAAQGAVSLAANVDEWNKIIERNFMSDGIAKDLADKKKNTIQGLWYQLTSTFTEQGMKVFEDMESPIRNFLIEIREWVGSDEFRKTLGTLGSTLMDIFGVFKKFTTILIDVYERFGSLIKMWLVAQLHLSALLVPLRVFKSLINFAGLIASAAKSIGLLSLQFGNLFRVLSSGATMRSKIHGLWSTIAPSNMLVSAAGRVHKNVDPAVLRRYQAMYGHAPYGFGKTAALGFGSMLGAGLGGYIGAQVGDPGSTGNIVSTLLGTGIGGAVGLAIPKAVGALGALVGISGAAAAGIVGVVAALGFGVYKWVEWKKEVDKCTKAHDEFLTSTRSINGINYSENASKADKYLAIIYNKQLDVNQAISAHIQLVREQLGIMDEAKQSTETFGTKHKDKFENMTKHYSWFAPIRESYWQHATRDILRPDGSVDPRLSITSIGKRTDIYGNSPYTVAYFNKSAFTVPEHLEIARSLYAMGSDVSEGTTLKKKIDETTERLLRVTSLADYDAILQDARAWSEGLTIAPGSHDWSADQLKNANNWEQNYHWVTATQQTLEDYLTGSDNVNAIKLNTWRQILGLYENNQTIPEDLLYKFLAQSGIMAFDERFGAKFGSAEFMRKWGWDGNEWGTLQYDTGRKDKNNKPIMGMLDSTATRAAFMQFFDQITEIVNQMKPELKQQFSGILNHPVWQYGSNNGPVVKNVGDEVWQWDAANGVWNPVVGNGQGPKMPISQAEMLKKMAEQGGGADTNTTPNPKQYQQHYNNGSAAPKQVIVRIENLMNVNSIDLSNPDNTAVLNNLKGQVAQILIDAVHDFDLTYHS